MEEYENTVFIILTLISLVWLFKKKYSKTQLPPSPPGLPIIGHMHHLSKIPHQGFHKLSVKYGPLIYFFIGSKPSLLASSPQVAKEILKTHESNFLNRSKTANLDYLTYGSADFVTAEYGPYWKFMKKLCMTELLGARSLEKFLQVRCKETNRFLNFMLKKAVEGEAVNVGHELMRLTNNTISSMALSTRCSDLDSEADEVRKMVKQLTELAAKFNFSDSFWFCKNIDLQGFGKRLREARDKYDFMIERIIKEREHERKKKKGDENCGRSDEVLKDVLDVLLDIYEDESSEIRLTRENIKAFLMNMFGAGTDTSSITIEWGLAELINHPEIMEKARKEIDMVVGNKRIVEESDIANLPYLQAIVKEVLRLHPTGPLIVRESNEDCTISGYHIPAKTRVFVNVWSIGRDPNSWEAPLEFKPQRFTSEEDWTGKSNMVDVRGQNFQLLPFGSGRRACPGASFALQLVLTTLAAMIQCFEWKVSDGDYSGTIDMEEGPGLALLRANSIVCVPIVRLHLFPSSTS